MTNAQDVIAATLVGRKPTASLVRECRWALQRAGFDPFDREAALLAAGVIKPLQQDFGAMVEGIS